MFYSDLSHYQLKGFQLTDQKRKEKDSIIRLKLHHRSLLVLYFSAGILEVVNFM